MRFFRPLLCGAGLASVVVASASAQNLQIATDFSPVGLDPHVATAFSTVMIDSVIYEGLTAIDHSLHVVPSLASSWTVSPDALTYDFTLRPNAMFQNGRAMTPQDVIASIARVRDPKTGSPYASRFSAIASVTATGPHSVRITLKQPSAPLLAQLAALAIVPAEAVATLQRKPVGTGPFAFREWVPDTDIALVRNPHYWAKGLPKLGGITFNIVPEAATRQLGLTSGSYAMLPAIDAATAEALMSAPGVTVEKAQDLAYSLVGLNVSRPPFNNPEVRRALNMVLNREQIVQAAYFGQGVPGGPLSPALKDWALPSSAFPCYAHDAAAAKALLQKAGVRLPVKATLDVFGGLQQVIDVAQVVQAQAKAAGFEFALNVEEPGRFIQEWKNSRFQGFVSLNSGGADPDDYLGRTFQTGGAVNVFKYSDPTIDALLNRARAISDPAQRKPLYDNAQKLLACTGPVVHLVYGTLFTAVRNTVHGFHISPTRSLRSLRAAFVTK